MATTNGTATEAQAAASSQSDSQMDVPAAVEDKKVKKTTKNATNNQPKQAEKKEAASRKRTADKGLDGGYWSQGASATAAEDTRSKRRRTAVERLVDVTLLEQQVAAPSTNNKRPTRSASAAAANMDSGDSDDEAESSADDEAASQHTGTASSASAASVQLFKAGMFLTVREESGGFFVCKTLTSIYDHSKRSKIQWLEETPSGKYKLGYVDWIAKESILAKVHMIKSGSNEYAMEESDLKRVKKLLAIAKEEGGIPLEVAEQSPSSQEEKTSSPAKKKKAVSIKQQEKDEDTEELEDEPAAAKTKKKKLKKASKEKVESEASKKRRLLKVISNRFLVENTHVIVPDKDPFFEQEPTAQLYISPFTQAKHAFRAVFTRDLKLLRELCANTSKRYPNVPPVHVSRGAFLKWTPAEYAVYLGNTEALAVLIDDFVSCYTGAKKNLCEVPKTMFRKFTTGTFQPRSFGSDWGRARRLTESRGAKEGNNAFNKDEQAMALVEQCGQQQQHQRKGYIHQINTFFQRLVDVALEYGASTEVMDLIMTRTTKYEKYVGAHNRDRRIYDGLIRAITMGHRKLVAHLLENIPPGHGFNAVHMEVLKGDDGELKTPVRANMCTKKPMMNDQVTPIHCACINPNVSYLKSLLALAPELNITDRRGRRPIHYAAVCEGCAPLEYLLTRVSSPYDLDSAGNTPLHHACQAGRAINVETLLALAKQKHEQEAQSTAELHMDERFGLGAVNKPNRRGLLPLHLAIERSHDECVNVLLKYGCQVDYPNSTARGKMTPLMLACQQGNYRIVQLLCENGKARVEARDRFKRTAAMHATMCGHARILSYLLRRGASSTAVDSSGNSLMHYACAYGWYECMKVLIEAGATLSPANDWRLTPFGVAFLKGHVGLCDELVRQAPRDIDINFRTEDGETLVMMAVSGGEGSEQPLYSESTVEQLEYIVRTLGGDVQLRDHKGNNAFHYVSANHVDREALEEELKRAGAPKTKVDALLAEHDKCRARMARLLLDAGCSATAENFDLETPLLVALASGNAKFAHYLLAHEADTVQAARRTLKGGKTLLHIVAENALHDADMGALVRDDKLMSKFSAQFEKMAAAHDDAGMTPLASACLLVKNKLKATSTPKNYVVPEHFIQVMEFLVTTCKSELNQLIELKEAAAAPQQAKSGRRKLNIYTDNTVTTSNEEDEPPQEAKRFFTPVFALVDDRCCALVERLLRVTKNAFAKTFASAEHYDSKGRTPLIKAIQEGHSKLALLFVAHSTDLPQQVCKNELRENLLQLCVRHRQASVFEALAGKMPLQYENAYGQNVFHLMAVTHNNFLSGALKKHGDLAKLLSAQDKLGRTPLHACLLSRDETASDIDLEIFLAENTPSASLAAKDLFDRMPLHYLFFNAKLEKIHFGGKKAANLYKLPPSELKKKQPLYLGSDAAAAISVIDPVELLTLLTQGMQFRSLDTKDAYGYTPLHYAAVRGATVSCSLLMSYKCDVLAASPSANTPLASAIYFERETCVLTMLRQGISLRDSYHLHRSEYDLDYEEEEEEETDEPNLKLLTAKLDRERNPLTKYGLYELILSNKWEGISWLVLGKLDDYALNVMEVLVAALHCADYGFALRLLDKYEQQQQQLSTYVSSHGRSVLHTLALLGNDNNASLRKIVEKVLRAGGVELVKKRDEFGTTCMHYACHMLNLSFVQVVLDTLGGGSGELLTLSDAFQHTPFALLFWQVGRVKYAKDVKEAIVSLASKYKLSAATAAASYPLITDTPNLNVPSANAVPLRDYPPVAAGGAAVAPLLYAINRQDVDMCKFLVTQLNADVNVQDAAGLRAIVYAIRTNNAKICALLIDPSTALDGDVAEAVATTPKKKAANQSALGNLRVRALMTAKKAAAASSSDDDESSSDAASDFAEDEMSSDDDDDDDDDASDDDEEMQVDEEPAPKKSTTVHPAVQLNVLDKHQRSIFHHLACALDYGSFSNADLCKTLLAAFQGNVTDFLKRADDKSLTALDYAVLSGNQPLADQFQKLVKTTSSQQMPKFQVNDHHTANAVDFTLHAKLFMDSYTPTKKEDSSNDQSIFKVDPLSNMSKVGQLVWDPKATDVPYDCILTKTEVVYGLYGLHNFYKMQLITHAYNTADENGLCVLFTRWGRIGDQGQCQRTPFANFKEARDEFCKLFKQKTGNDFAETCLDKSKPFENKPKRYSLVQFEKRRRQKLRDIDFALFSSEQEQLTAFNKSRLAPSRDHYHFFRDLLDANFLKAHVTAHTQLSTDYLPLTQLSAESLERAEGLLHKLQTLIERRLEMDKLHKRESLGDYGKLLDEITTLSNEYYTLIPQMDFNYERLAPISSESDVDTQQANIAALKNAQLAIRVLMGARYAATTLSINPFDYVYDALACKFELASGVETQYIMRYVGNSATVKRIFKFERRGEPERFERCKVVKRAPASRVLLWHGSGTQNMISIMTRGLLKEPREARLTGHRYGKGVYFSDSFAFSSQFAHGKARRKYMLLCEVALGATKELRTSYETVDGAPHGFDSVRAVSELEPERAHDVFLLSGCRVPLGAPVKVPLLPGEYAHQRCKESMYVVYDEAQICIRYIVQYHE